MNPDIVSAGILCALGLGGYLLGSLSFGLLAARMGGLGDLRQIGSGNIGATNVLRTGRKDLALFTLLGDSGKGALAVLIAHLSLLSRPDLIESGQAVAAGSAFVGHVFPLWLGFKGGKGVATFFGTLLAAAWPVGLLSGATWILVAAVFRISSLAGIVAAAVAPLLAYATHQPYPAILLSAFMAVLIIVRHKPNIERLLAGSEPRFGGKKADTASDPAP